MFKSLRASADEVDGIAKPVAAARYGRVVGG
jgi:hypothetical protein